MELDEICKVCKVLPTSCFRELCGFYGSRAVFLTEYELYFLV